MPGKLCHNFSHWVWFSPVYTLWIWHSFESCKSPIWCQGHSGIPGCLRALRYTPNLPKNDFLNHPARLLCPWNSPGKNTGVGSYPLLQGIFLTQGLNSSLLHCGQILYSFEPPGKPKLNLEATNLPKTSEKGDE